MYSFYQHLTPTLDKLIAEANYIAFHNQFEIEKQSLTTERVNELTSIAVTKLDELIAKRETTLLSFQEQKSMALGLSNLFSQYAIKVTNEHEIEELTAIDKKISAVRDIIAEIEPLMPKKAEPEKEEAQKTVAEPASWRCSIM